MGAEQHPAFPEELGRLRATVARVQVHARELAGANPLTVEGEGLEEESMHGIRATELSLEGRRRYAVWRLRMAAAEPYFGRVDFQEQGAPEIESFYIGKSSLEDVTGHQPLVIDWRAPLATLFYTVPSAGDAVQYDAPGGTICGALRLKRHLAVRRGGLRHIADSHVSGGEEQAVGDTYLLYALQESRDGRLRDIVATIRAEQNAIIRAPADRALVIQGVAGSGKTSVALHRLAYLLYTQRAAMDPDRILILAPNRIFLDYISDVLPELGVGGVQQTTFADWALAQIRRPPALVDPAERLEHLFAPGAGGGPGAPGRHKGSLAFLATLDRALAAYEAAFVPACDLTLWPGATLNRAQVAALFYQRFGALPLNTRRRRVLARVARWARGRAAAADDPDPRQRLLRAMLAVRAYSARWPRHTAAGLYAEILGAPPAPGREPAPVGQPEVPADLAAATLPILLRGEATPEDLPALLYLHERLDGIRDDRELHHVVVDEAQDFSAFGLELLRRRTRGAAFTILGDLAQGIHTHTGVRAWDELTRLFPAGSVQYHELQISYRSTHPIVTFANQLLGPAGGAAAPAQPVFRPGPPVRVGHRVPGALADVLVGEVRRLRHAGHGSIAVVGRTEAECAHLQADLAAVGLRPRRVSARQDSYQGGLSVIPAYLVKGLEFDAVIVANAGAAAYAATPRDARLLYVVVTRALHELVIFYQDVPSPLLTPISTELYVTP